MCPASCTRRANKIPRQLNTFGLFLRAHGTKFNMHVLGQPTRTNQDAKRQKKIVRYIL
jgi:hypothetical protein